MYVLLFPGYIIRYWMCTVLHKCKTFSPTFFFIQTQMNVLRIAQETVKKTRAQNFLLFYNERLHCDLFLRNQIGKIVIFFTLFESYSYLLQNFLKYITTLQIFKVPTKKLVWGIGDIWRFWVMPRRSLIINT